MNTEDLSQLMERCVRIHCGSAYVKGAARNYRYVIGQLFVAKRRADGVLTLRATGQIVGPFRGWDKTEAAARELAAQHGAEFVPGYGSLHNTVLGEDCKPERSKP